MKFGNFGPRLANYRIVRAGIVSLCLTVALASPGSCFADDTKTARKHYNNNELHKALKMTEKLVKEKPADADRVGLLARIQYEMGQFDSARENIRKAAKLDKEIWGDLANSYEARIEFFFGNDAESKKYCAKLDSDSWVKKRLPMLMAPPGLDRSESKKKRYVIYTTKGLRKGGKKFCQKVMDTVYDAYSKVFPFKKDKRIKSRVYIFDNTNEYNRFNALRGRDNSTAAGFFAPSTRILVINADPRGAKVNSYGFCKDAIDTMFHEGFHQFINIWVPHIPDWFNEGVAEYFGPSEYIGRGKLRVGVVVKDGEGFVTRYDRIKRAITSHDPVAPLTLESFMSVRNTKFGGGTDRSRVNYAQAWSFIHFLLHSKAMGTKGKKLIKKYFTILKEGKTAKEAHAETFGKLNLKKMEKAWQAYVLSL